MWTKSNVPSKQQERATETTLAPEVDPGEEKDSLGVIVGGGQNCFDGYLGYDSPSEK